MKTLYLDTFAGMAGDMFLGLLVDLGVPLADLEAQLRCLPLTGYHLTATREQRQGIAATKVRVHCQPQHQHRTWRDIDAMLAAGELPGPVADLARRIFRRLGTAEAAVHGIDLDAVHFHEVGALDAIIDIVGAAIGLQALAPQQVLCAPLPMTRGTVRCAHGILPLPAPATLQLLCGLPTVGDPAAVELVTPTGAAIAAEIARFAPLPAMTMEAVGYGAGERHMDDRPNLLRGILGTTADPWEGETDRITQLDSHLDDANPEWLGALMEDLFQAGALDVTFAPLQMKKNRPGVRLTVLAPPALAAPLARLVLCASSATGVRCQDTLRLKLRRKAATVATPLGPARVKLFFDGGTLLRIAPEFEDCRRLAKTSGRPLTGIYQLVEQAAWADATVTEL